MSALTHSLKISRDSWHGRWYSYWLSLGGKAPATENFCHYVRVLMIWAPLKWFIHGKIRKVVPPWTIPVALVIVGLIVLACYLWPGVMQWVGIAAGGLVLAAGVIVGSVRLYDRDPKRAKRMLLKVTSPIRFVGRKIGSFLKKHESKIEAKLEWFIDREYTRFELTPLNMIVGTAFVTIVTLLAIFDPIKLLEIALVIAALAVLIGTIAGVVWIVEEIKMRRKRKRAHAPISQTAEKPKRAIIRAYESTADTVKLGATFVATKKRGSRICPFIRFEDADTA